MEDDPLIVRVGTFFLVIGWGAFLLFVVSDLAEQVNFEYLCVAMIMIGIGWAMRSKKAPPPSAGRFSIFRKKREDAKKKTPDKGKK
ncbi:MAG: hypothetical protein AB1649_26070 [Chloroflexota bacterium]